MTPVLPFAANAARSDAAANVASVAPLHSVPTSPCPECAARQEELTGLRQQVVELSQIVATDHLTGVLSRRALEEALVRELGRQVRYGHPCSLILCDLDHFKQINDVHGHAVGDRVLQVFTECLRKVGRDIDEVGRLGGEEFAVLLPNTGLYTALRVAERMRAAVKSLRMPPVEHIAASFGLAQANKDEPWRVWLQRADTAMYTAKAGGRDRIVLAPNRVASGSVDAVNANFMQLVWRDAYASGHPLIDAQHQRLFLSANDALNCAFTSDRANLLPMLRHLIDECRRHFADEERVLAGFAYAGAKGHAKVHERLLLRAENLYRAHETGPGDAGQLTFFIAGEVISSHILHEDRLYFDSLARLQHPELMAMAGWPATNAGFLGDEAD